jgi:hypothetical protein
LSHRNKSARTVVVRETHEPTVPENWPDGHVAVTLTGDDVGECIEVTIHGVKHYLHSTTARELTNMLESNLTEWNKKAKAHGAPGV